MNAGTDNVIIWWWEHPAQWWQFWFPMSGATGGALMGMVIIVVTGLLT